MRERSRVFRGQSALPLALRCCCWRGAAPLRPRRGHAAVPLAGKDAAFVDKYCSKCHNSTDWAGGLALDVLDHGNLAADGETWEEVVRKLRGALMPPPSEPQPSAADRKAFIRSDGSLAGPRCRAPM